MYTNLTRGDRVFCAGVMVMVEKGVGTSLGRELGLRRVARFSLPSDGGTGRVIARTGQLTGAHNLDAVKAALKTTR